jgi:hypothetical protein
MYGIELVFYSSEGSTYRIQVQRIIDDGTGTQPAAGSPTTIAYLRPPNTTLTDVFEEASTGYWYRGRLVDDSHEAVGAWSEYVGVKPVNVTTDAPNNVGRMISPDQGGMLPVNAQGDMLFAIDSDAWTQLAIGATGEVLTVQSSGVPNWDAPGAPGGTLEVGVHDSVLGQLTLRAPATGEAGGRIAIEVNPNHDTNVAFYHIDAFTDRLRFYADADVFAYYDDSADTFDFGCNVRVHGQTYPNDFYYPSSSPDHQDVTGTLGIDWDNGQVQAVSMGAGSLTINVDSSSNMHQGATYQLTVFGPSTGSQTLTIGNVDT